MAKDYGGTDYTLSTTTPVTAAPLTMAAWFNADSATAGDTLISISDSSATGNLFRLMIRGDVGGDPVRASTVTGGAEVSADTTTGYTTGTWMHACAVYASSTSRTAYISGGSSANNTTSSVPSSLDRIGLACDADSTIQRIYSGLLHWPAIWNVALTQQEISSLAAGADPRTIRPANLVTFVPLERDNFDIKGRTFTDTGTPAFVDSRPSGLSRYYPPTYQSPSPPPPPPPPSAPNIATFTVSPATVQTNEVVSGLFTNSGGEITLATIDYNGDSIADRTVTADVVDTAYTYAAPGSYTPTLSVTGPGGSDSATASPITVLSVAPAPPPPPPVATPSAALGKGRASGSSLS